MGQRKTWFRAGALLAVASLAAFSFIASACGGDDDDGDDAEPTTSAAASPTSGNDDAEPTSEATSDATDETPAAGDDTTILIRETSLGEVLTDADGLTLYTFANDTANSGTSACTGGCLNAWPAATVQGEPTGPDTLTGELGTITRDDGTTQVTYNGLPLYRFASDAAPGDTSGDGVGGVWDVATP